MGLPGVRLRPQAAWGSAVVDCSKVSHFLLGTKTQGSCLGPPEETRPVRCVWDLAVPLKEAALCNLLSKGHSCEALLLGCGGREDG